jgi:hypothetical protein
MKWRMRRTGFIGEEGRKDGRLKIAWGQALPLSCDG